MINIYFMLLQIYWKIQHQLLLSSPFGVNIVWIAPNPMLLERWELKRLRWMNSMAYQSIISILWTTNGCCFVPVGFVFGTLYPPGRRAPPLVQSSCLPLCSPAALSPILFLPSLCLSCTFYCSSSLGTFPQPSLCFCVSDVQEAHPSWTQPHHSLPFLSHPSFGRGRHNFAVGSSSVLDFSASITGILLVLVFHLFILK